METQSPKRPSLSPAAIVLAGIIIAGAIVFGDDIRLFVLGQSNKPPTALTTFKAYAKDLKLDKNKFAACLDSGKYKTAVDKDLSEGQAAGVGGTPTFFINGLPFVGAQPYERFREVIDRELAGPATGSAARPASPSAEQRVQIATNGSPARGQTSAPIIIVEFTDYQCPFCESYFQQTYRRIETNYINTGKVRYVVRDMPLAIIGHKNAPKAAEAARCAGEQGKYWEMHDALFNGQSTWANL